MHVEETWIEMGSVLPGDLLDEGSFPYANVTGKLPVLFFGKMIVHGVPRGFRDIS